MSCDIIKTPCTVPLKGRVSFSEEVTFVEIEDYDDEWEHEAWFQKRAFCHFASDIKTTISIFRNMAGFAMDKEKNCLRGTESYLRPGQQWEETPLLRAAINTVLIETEGQFH